MLTIIWLCWQFSRFNQIFTFRWDLTCRARPRWASWRKWRRTPSEEHFILMTNYKHVYRALFEMTGKVCTPGRCRARGQQPEMVSFIMRSISWSPNSTDLYFWYLSVELAVVTPVERRNFVSVVPAAKKSNLGPIFFLNILVVYKLSVKKQETGQKTGKNPPKKVVFPAPPTSWPSLSSKVGNFWGKSCQLLRQKLPSQLLRQKLSTFEDRPGMLHNISAKDCYVAQHIRQGEEELVKFTNHLNSFHQTIKFDVVKASASIFLSGL